MISPVFALSHLTLKTTERYKNMSPFHREKYRGDKRLTLTKFPGNYETEKVLKFSFLWLQSQVLTTVKLLEYFFEIENRALLLWFKSDFLPCPYSHAYIPSKSDYPAVFSAAFLWASILNGAQNVPWLFHAIALKDYLGRKCCSSNKTAQLSQRAFNPSF